MQLFFNTIEPLSLNIFKNIVDKITLYNSQYKVKLFSNMIFIGGEPTLNPYLDSMIEYSTINGLKPIVVTNGLKLSDMKYAKKICQDGVSITTHLPLFGNDGEAILDEATKRSGYTKKLKQGINNLLELRNSGRKIDLIGELVVCNTTKKYAFDSYVYCRENNIEPFFELMRISNDAYTNKHLLLEEEDIKALGENIYNYDLANNFVSDDLVKRTRYFLPPAVNSPCTLIQNSIHIKYEKEGFGKVISCCGQSIGHGNIINNSFEEILNHKQNTKIFSEQKKHIKGPCAICKLYDLTGCEGGCRGNAKNTFDCAEASDPQCIYISSHVCNDINIMTCEKGQMILEEII